MIVVKPFCVKTIHNLYPCESYLQALRLSMSLDNINVVNSVVLNTNIF